MDRNGIDPVFLNRILAHQTEHVSRPVKLASKPGAGVGDGGGV
jgi:hypothetical protein